MGYVAIFCICCGGPISHGYGFDGALEDWQEEHNKQVKNCKKTKSSPPQKYKLKLDDMSWLDELRVIHEKCENNTPSEILEYEEFGCISTPVEGKGEDDELFVSLSCYTWGEKFSGSEDVEDVCGISIHDQCWKLLSPKLVASKKSLKEFFRAYYNIVKPEIDRINDLREKETMKKKKKKQKLVTLEDEEKEQYLSSNLIPSIDYGADGAIGRKATQFYELEAGLEWLLVSPELEKDDEEKNVEIKKWSRNNRLRIENVINQLMEKIFQQSLMKFN